MAPQKSSVNALSNQVSRRGEALGTASLHRTPHRASRNDSPTWLQDTLRVSQRVILLGHIEVLLFSAYFYASRAIEVKNKSDLLLAELYQHCASSNMPFLIAADFNNPVIDFPAFRAFRSIRCQEAFDLARHKFAKDLPPTCRSTTRNDSFVIHEALVPWVSNMWVGPEHVFPDHRPLYVQFQLPGTQRLSQNWDMPCSW